MRRGLGPPSLGSELAVGRTIGFKYSCVSPSSRTAAPANARGGASWRTDKVRSYVVSCCSCCASSARVSATMSAREAMPPKNSLSRLGSRSSSRPSYPSRINSRRSPCCALAGLDPEVRRRMRCLRRRGATRRRSPGSSIALSRRGSPRGGLGDELERKQASAHTLVFPSGSRRDSRRSRGLVTAEDRELSRPDWRLEPPLTGTVIPHAEGADYSCQSRQRSSPVKGGDSGGGSREVDR